MKLKEFNLDNEQKKAVLCKDKTIIVNALAGSGKTRIIHARIHDLIKRQKVNPESILCLSYERAGESELKKRLSSYGVEIKTFHKLCAQILSEDNIAFQKTNQLEQLDLIRRLYTSLYPNMKMTKKKVENKLQLFSKQINRLKILVDDIKPSKTFNEADITVYKHYLKKLKKQGGDFDWMIKKTLDLLQKDKNVRSKLRNKYEHILIDEAHDVTKLLASIVAEINPQNLFIVGDKNQNIYRWRGSTEILLNEKFLESARSEKPTCISLSTNYRSSQNLITFFNSFLKHNALHEKARFKSLRKRKGLKPILFHGKTREQELETILFFCKNITREKYGYTNTAILVRKNKYIASIALYLKKNGIPVRIKSEIDFKSKEGEVYFALLKCLNKDYGIGKIHLKISMNNLIKGLGRAKLETLFKYAQRKNLPVYKAYIRAPISQKMKDKILKFYKHFKNAKNQKPHVGFIEMLNHSKWKQHLKSDSDKINQVKMLIKALKQVSSLDDFFEEHSQLQTKGKTRKDAITVGTIHSVKGKGYSAVCLAFSGKKSFLPPKHNDLDEARIAFVGMTRAKRFLLITSNKENGSLVPYFAIVNAKLSHGIIH